MRSAQDLGAELRLGRITGLLPGEFLEQEVTGPLGIDFTIGLPEKHADRTAQLVHAPASGTEAFSLFATSGSGTDPFVAQDFMQTLERGNAVSLRASSTTIANTPLQGANTNLAGVFQVNDVSRSYGMTSTFNSWIVTSPGFFGKAKRAMLTVYAVRGTAPALITGNERPISNVVRETFTIGG